MANHFNVLALRTPWIAWKGKKIWYWKMSLPGRMVSNILLGKSMVQLLLALERTKQLGQVEMRLSCRYVWWWVWCCKGQYCMGNRNVRHMNQGKLDVFKQETARLKINILGISGWRGKLNSDDHYMYYCGQESLRRNGTALTVNKKVWNAVLGCNLKNDRWSQVVSKANHSTSQ